MLTFRFSETHNSLHNQSTPIVSSYGQYGQERNQFNTSFAQNGKEIKAWIITAESLIFFQMERSGSHALFLEYETPVDKTPPVQMQHEGINRAERSPFISPEVRGAQK